MNMPAIKTGPVTARFLRLASSLGPIRMVGSENGIDGPGAVVEFGPQSGTIIFPHARSAPKRLTFALDRVDRVTNATGAGLVHFQADLLAPPTAGGSQ